MTQHRSPSSLEMWRRHGAQWRSERTGQVISVTTMGKALQHSGQDAGVACQDHWALLPDPEGVCELGPGSVGPTDTLLPMPANGTVAEPLRGHPGVPEEADTGDAEVLTEGTWSVVSAVALLPRRRLH